jgi:hypothetical protein
VNGFLQKGGGIGGPSSIELSAAGRMVVAVSSSSDSGKRRKKSPFKGIEAVL